MIPQQNYEKFKICRQTNRNNDPIQKMCDNIITLYNQQSQNIDCYFARIQTKRFVYTSIQKGSDAKERAKYSWGSVNCVEKIISALDFANKLKCPFIMIIDCRSVSNYSPLLEAFSKSTVKMCFYIIGELTIPLLGYGESVMWSNAISHNNNSNIESAYDLLKDKLIDRIIYEDGHDLDAFKEDLLKFLGISGQVKNFEQISNTHFNRVE